MKKINTELVKNPYKFKKYDFVGKDSFLKFSQGGIDYDVFKMTDNHVDTYIKKHPEQKLFVKK